MKKAIAQATASLALITLLIAACKKDDDPGLINPADANALAGVLVVPNSNRESGSAPASNGSPSAPSVSNPVVDYTSSNGSTLPLNFNYDNVTGNLGGCYIQVEGAGSYFNVPYNSQSGNSGYLSVPIGIPTNVDSGQFCIRFSIYDINGRVSNVVTNCVNVLRLGTGAVQVSLSWNTATDQDLYVLDPLGTKIYFSNEYSSSGGQLDRDDVTGYGPENIFWLENAPDGEYKIWGHDYEETATPNTLYITINAGGKAKTFTFTTQNGSKTDIITMTKSGSEFSF